VPKRKNVADDDLPVWADVSYTVVQCDCCGKPRLKRTMKLHGPTIDQLHIGVVCCGKWFAGNKTRYRGNPNKAVKRLRRDLQAMSSEEVQETINAIRESAQEW